MGHVVLLSKGRLPAYVAAEGRWAAKEHFDPPGQITQGSTFMDFRRIRDFRRFPAESER